MMEKEDSVQKLYTRMRLWEFPDQYVIEPTDGSSGSSLSVSRVDGSMKLIGQFFSSLLFVLFLAYVVLFAIAFVIFSNSFPDRCLLFYFMFSAFSGCVALTDELPECSTLRVPKIYTIFGVVGMLKLLAGEQSLDLMIDIVDLSDYFILP